MLRGDLLLAGAGALAAADDLVVHAAVVIGVFLGQLLAALGHALGIMLADILLLVGIVIADALLLHHGSQFRPALGTALGTLAALLAGMGTALTGPLAALLALTGPLLEAAAGTVLEIALGGTLAGSAALPCAGGEIALSRREIAGRALGPLALGTALEIALGGTLAGLHGGALGIGASLALLRDGLTPGQHPGRGAHGGPGRWRGGRSRGGRRRIGRGSGHGCGLGRGGSGSRRRRGRALLLFRLFRGGRGSRRRLGLLGLFLDGCNGGGLRRGRFRLGLLRGRLDGSRLLLLLVGHGPCLGVLLYLQALLRFVLLALHLRALTLQLLEQLLGAAAHPRGFLQHRACFLIEFFGGFLQLNLRHSTLAPPDSLSSENFIVR